MLPPRYLLLSLLLHVSMGVLLMTNIRLVSSPQPLPPPVSMKVLHTRAVPMEQLLEHRRRIAEEQARQQRAKAAAEEQRRQEIRLRQQQVEEEQRQKELAAEQQRLVAEQKRLAAEQREKAEAEQQRLAEEQRQRELQEEQQRLAEEQRQRELEEEQKRLAEEQRQRELQEEQQRLAEEQRQRAEAERRQREQTEIERYKGLIVNRIADKFNRTGLDRGLSCTLLIRLTSSGEIVRASIIESSGNEVFDRRAEAAVFAAAPLPLPESAEISSKMRTLRTVFRPWDE